ncbi:hypothetical protein CSB93_1282 [Pseudomonas paraeruginosa]|uniref:Uncharacterized protein n=1 Tax=Pseudomonas paraeruginosa TaxID=2994495 RepID=A0A2R3IMC0_9PSED|nr:hypothetical protein CSB93_1282 [Pseudomonas paraeruginosa]
MSWGFYCLRFTAVYLAVRDPPGTTTMPSRIKGKNKGDRFIFPTLIF